MVPADSHRISRVPRYSGYYLAPGNESCKGLSPAMAVLSKTFHFIAEVCVIDSPTTPDMPCDTTGLGWCAFARHYLRNHFCFLLLRVLRCFSSPRLLPAPAGCRPLRPAGCPIRTSRDQRVFAPTPGFSQLITSFIASESPGIHRLPLLTFSTHTRRRYILLHRRRMSHFFQLALLRFFSSIYLHFPTCQRSYFVENNGFEPLTLCLQSRCSSQLS